MAAKSSSDVYRAVVLWDRRRRKIRIDEADTTPLIGMELLAEHELNLKVRQGGVVTIKPLRR